jgi:hypothetical protein
LAPKLIAHGTKNSPPNEQTRKGTEKVASAAPVWTAGGAAKKPCLQWQLQIRRLQSQTTPSHFRERRR